MGMSIDYLYGELPEVVDPFTYQSESKDDTVRLTIDNDKRIISASVLKTPAKLTILQGETNNLIFDGSTNTTILIPLYRMENVVPDNGDIRKLYVLKKYNFEKGLYELIGDTIYFEEQLDELNIENGSIDSDTESTKIARGNGGLTSSKCRINESVIVPALKLPSTNEILNLPNMGGIVGQRVGYINGGTLTGLLSVAFGGQAYGLCDLSLVKLSYLGEDYFYYIASEFPVILKSLDDRITCTTDSYYGDLYFYIPSMDGSTQKLSNMPCYVEWDNRQIISKIMPKVRSGSISIVRGFKSNSSAKGVQSFSMGGGTLANSMWSQAFGVGTSTSASGQMSIGTFNLDEHDALFVVGNGYYDVLSGTEMRSNAFSVMRDGTIKLYNKLNNTTQTLDLVMYECVKNNLPDIVDNGVLS